MNQQVEAMKLAIEAADELEWMLKSGYEQRREGPPRVHRLIGKIKALAQPQQEPVAWMHEWEDGEKIPMLKGRDDRNQDKPKTVRPLVYGDTSPQPAQQEPLGFMNAGSILEMQQKSLPYGYVYPEKSTGVSVAVYTSPPAQPQQEPVATLWQQAPIRTTWGDEMMVASVAIDNDHTLSLYCERDQTPKVDAMFAQRKPLTDEEIIGLWQDTKEPDGHRIERFARAVEAAHGIKENT